jgi:hypothetical protein
VSHDPSHGLLESNDPSLRGKERHSRNARNATRGDERATWSHSASVLLQGANGVFSIVFAGALMIVSVGFSMLLIAAILVVFLCGLACYS